MSILRDWLRDGTPSGKSAPETLREARLRNDAEPSFPPIRSTSDFTRTRPVFGRSLAQIADLLIEIRSRHGRQKNAKAGGVSSRTSDREMRHRAMEAAVSRWHSKREGHFRKGRRAGKSSRGWEWHMVDPSLADGRVVATDIGCLIHGQPRPGIPTLVWPEGIDEAASDWFRDLMVRGGRTTGTAHEYAKILRLFLRFCRAKGRAWQDVDDEFLIPWFEHLHRGKRLSINRTNTCLTTISKFYKWAEDTGRIDYSVGIYAEDGPTECLPGSFSRVSQNASLRKRRPSDFPAVGQHR